MLQQTRVDTVRRYYDRFLQRFPNVKSLAAAQETTVMKLWEGLGYYRRARNLHRSAKDLVSDRRDIPTTAASLRRLAGIGEYTAAAISSIAFGEVVPAIDGNVVRVVARLFAITENVDTRTGKSDVARFALELISPSRPGDFNQAWMDLGRLICTPQSPCCPACPLRKHCRGYADGIVHQLPMLSRKKPPKAVRILATLFMQSKRVLVIRENGCGWWSGLWSFPSMERTNGSSLPGTFRDLANRHGLAVKTIPKQTATLRHQLTHRTIHFDIRLCNLSDSCATAATRLTKNLTDAKWVTPKQFEQLPVSTAHRKIWAQAMKKLGTTECVGDD